MKFLGEKKKVGHVRGKEAMSATPDVLWTPTHDVK